MTPKVDGYKAHEWLAGHGKECEKYAGQWVAASETGIVAASKSFKKLMRLVERLDVSMPLISQIPPNDGAHWAPLSTLISLP